MISFDLKHLLKTECDCRTIAGFSTLRFFQKLKNYHLKRFGIKLINYAMNNTVLQLRDKRRTCTGYIMDTRKIRDTFKSDFRPDVPLFFERNETKGKINIRTSAIVPRGVFDFKVPNMATERHRS